MIKQIVFTLTLTSILGAADPTPVNHLAEYWKAQSFKATQVSILQESLTSKQKQMIESAKQMEEVIQAAKDSLTKDCTDVGLVLGGADGLTCVEGQPKTPPSTK